MRLRAKLMLLLAGVGGSFIAAMLSIVFFSVLPAFERVERAEATADAERLTQAIEREQADLLTHARDYAVWDETYAYMVDRNLKYVESNLTPSTSFETLNIQVMMLFDSSGQKVWGDIRRAEGLSELAELPERLKEGHPLLFGPEEIRGRTGLLLTAHGALLLAAHPILTSNIEGPSRGSFVVGRFLDAAEWSSLSRQVNLSLHHWTLPGKGLKQSDTDSLRALEAGDGPVLKVLSPDTIGAYVLVRDLTGAPALLVRTDIPRRIYLQGVQAAELSMLLAIGLMLILAPLLGMLLQRFVVAPIAGLTRHILSLDAEGAEALRQEGGDEVTVLSVAYHRMVQALTRTQQELREAAARAEEASRAKSLFLAAMSHEIRTPLNGIVAAAELLEGGQGGLPGEQRQLTRIIRTSSHVLQATIEDVLDFSKIEAGYLHFQPVNLSLAQLVEDAADVIA
ncbi:MAG: hypothetical protein K2Q10_02310, partial [Rhodospirillales bacterium]|nr:hypothetical protein [Rhodospirillales bacterium]